MLKRAPINRPANAKDISLIYDTVQPEYSNLCLSLLRYSSLSFPLSNTHTHSLLYTSIITSSIYLSTLAQNSPSAIQSVPASEYPKPASFICRFFPPLLFLTPVHHNIYLLLESISDTRPAIYLRRLSTKYLTAQQVVQIRQGNDNGIAT